LFSNDLANGGPAGRRTKVALIPCHQYFMTAMLADWPTEFHGRSLYLQRLLPSSAVSSSRRRRRAACLGLLRNSPDIHSGKSDRNVIIEILGSSRRRRSFSGSDQFGRRHIAKVRGYCPWPNK
jgi:hypothetical protein